MVDVNLAKNKPINKRVRDVISKIPVNTAHDTEHYSVTHTWTSVGHEKAARLINHVFFKDKASIRWTRGDFGGLEGSTQSRDWRLIFYTDGTRHRYKGKNEIANEAIRVLHRHMRFTDTEPLTLYGPCFYFRDKIIGF